MGTRAQTHTCARTCARTCAHTHTHTHIHTNTHTHTHTHDHTQVPESSAIKLYQYVAAGNTGKWELASNNARPRLYDAQEDSNTRKQDW